MKKMLGVLLILLAAASARAQNVVITEGSGAPAGSCSFVRMYINTVNGDTYNCWLGTWQLIAVGGGGAISGSGTNNRITKWTGASTIGNSQIVDTGAAITIPGAVSFTAMTAGSIPFFGTAGLLSQDNANLFWSGTSLGIGDNSVPASERLRVSLSNPDGGITQQVLLFENSTDDPGGNALKVSATFTPASGGAGEGQALYVVNSYSGSGAADMDELTAADIGVSVGGNNSVINAIGLRVRDVSGASSGNYAIKTGLGATELGGKFQQIATATGFSATPTFDAALQNHFSITLTANVTSSTLSGSVTAGYAEIITFLICQDGTGTWTFAWPANVFGGMTISPTANKCNSQSFRYDGTNAYALSSGLTGM